MIFWKFFIYLVEKLVFNSRNNKNYDVFNIGYGSQTKTIDLIKIIENELNLKDENKRDTRNYKFY